MVLDRFFRWYWRITGRHVVFALGLVAIAVLAACVVLPVVIAVRLYFSLPAGALAVFTATVTAVIGVGLPLTMMLDSRVRTTRRWRAGHDVDPVVLWDTLVHLSWSAAAKGTPMLIVGHCLVSVPMLNHYAHLSTTEFVAALVSGSLITCIGGLVLALGMQLALHPAMDEVLPLLPAVLPPLAPTPSMLRRFQAASLSATLIGALSVGGVVAAQHTRTARFDSAVVAGVVIAVYATTVVHWTLLEPSLRPLSTLMDATRRVRHGDFSAPVPITTADELGHLARSFNEMQRGLAERDALHSAFGSYVDPVLAQRLLDDGSSIFDGQDVDVTVLFADVWHFTTYAEEASPADAVALLNTVFDKVVPIIDEHGGHTNHYLGDGLLAIFGAPSPLDNHADAAVAAAIAIQHSLRANIDVRVGIGLNTGRVLAGTIGGGGRYEFTVIGDVVNTAARVEQLTRERGDAILLTDATFQALSAPRPRTSRRGAVRIRGKSSTVELRALNP